MDLPTPDIEGYKAGNPKACHEQLVSLIAANPPPEDGTSNDVARAFAFEVAAGVGAEYCDHSIAPEPMPSMKAAAAKVAAAEHPGLCGVYHAHIIAAVKTQGGASTIGLNGGKQVPQSSEFATWTSRTRGGCGVAVGCCT